MKTQKVMPSDFVQKLTLSDIQHWNRLTRTIAEKTIAMYGYYTCMVNGKKTIIIK